AQEKDEAFAASSAIVRGSVAVGIAMVIAAALVAFLVARAVTRPIGQLAASARDVAEGNLKATAVVTGKDEIGVLAHAINRMTESLLSASKRRELEESIAKFAALVQSSSDFIAITSLDGNVQFINRGGRALVGLEPDEDVTSLTMNDFLAEEDLRAADEIGISAVKATGQWTGESTLRHFRDGSAIPVLIDSFAIADPETGHPIAQATIQRNNTARKQAEDALRENEARTRKIIDTAYDAFISIGTDDVITAWNSQAEQIFGWTREEAIGLRFAKTIIPLRYRTAHENGIERFLATGEGPVLNERIEISALHRDGHEFPVELAIWKVGSGDELAFNAFIHDITERKQAEEELRKLSRAVEQSPSLVMITDPNGNIEYVNPKFTEVTGYLPEDVLGKNPRILQSGETSPEVYSRLWQTITSGGQWRGDLHNKRKSGELYWASAVIAPVLDEEGAVVHYVGLQEDVTKRKEAEDAIGHLAFHDPLTGLPNRRLFTDRLALALTQARRTRDAVAVLFLDLDHFKTVNDTAGHGKGDELLQSVGQRLTKVVRDGDTVSRLGGDEFTVLLPGISQVEDAAEVAERILEEFRGPWVLDGYTFHLTISIGIGLYPDDGEDAKTLLTNADTALYRAKAQGRDNFQFYYSEMNASILERTDLEADLRGALEREEFVIHYQPQVNITTGRVVGMEALVRWQHPDRGLIPPVEFIPLAEETGLILPLGERLLRTACEQHKAWREAGLPSIRMAVNLSARQFKSRKLTATVSRILEETGLDPGFLQLEITEGVAMQDMEATTAILRALREVGVEVALDDFGTGYSSLGYLANFPIDVLKIDRSFVSDLPMDESAVAITTAIITLAHSLNLSVIAEGIETDEQLAWLKTHGCDEFQGYLFSKPLPAGEIETLLGRSQSLETSKR
ncbi:MAG: EAL domain-containing protein, partial [Dehalococcoidia bacterium]